MPPKELAQVERLFDTDDEIEVAGSEDYLGLQEAGTKALRAPSSI